MNDTPNTNKIFVNSVPYVQNESGDCAVPVANIDGTPLASGDAANTARTTATKVLPVQEVDPAGNVDSRATLGADAESNTSTRRKTISWLMGYNGTTWDRLRTAVSTATSTLTGFLNTLPLLKYVSSAETLTNGQVSGFKGDVNSNLLVSQGTSLNYAIDSITQYQGGCTCTTVDLATDADVVVTANPAYLLGVYVSVAMSAHVANVQDNATVIIALPASTAAGTNIDCHSATFATNITINSNDAATGTLLIFWRPA